MAIIWGANGHTVVAYGSLANTTELDRVQSTGLRSYRIDIYNDTSDTGAKNVLRAQIDNGVSRGVSILPVMIVHIEQYANDAAVYTASYNMAVYWVSAFMDVKVWEVGNESEIWNNTMKPNTSGASFSDYNDVPFETNRQFYLGMIAGIRATNPAAKVVVGTSGWHHYGFLQRLWANGVRWDISCFHWYSDMGDATNFSGGTNHFQILKDSFGLPIYVTEVNARPLSMASRQAEADWLIATMTQWDSIAATYNIRAVHIYELLDEPEKSGDSPEAIFGMYTETGVIKPMGTSVKNYLTANPSRSAFAASITTAAARTSLASNITDNTTGLVTTAKFRTVFTAMLDAMDSAVTSTAAARVAMTNNTTGTVTPAKVRLAFTSALDALDVVAGSTAAARTALASNVTDNTSGDVTPAKLRAVFTAVFDAMDTVTV